MLKIFCSIYSKIGHLLFCYTKLKCHNIYCFAEFGYSRKLEVGIFCQRAVVKTRLRSAVRKFLRRSCSVKYYKVNKTANSWREVFFKMPALFRMSPCCISCLWTAVPNHVTEEEGETFVRDFPTLRGTPQNGLKLPGPACQIASLTAMCVSIAPVFCLSEAVEFSHASWHGYWL